MKLQHKPEWYAAEAAAIGREIQEHAKSNGHRRRRPAPQPPAFLPPEPDTICDDVSPAKAPLLALTLPELEKHVFDHRRPILYRDGTVMLREGHLAQIYAPRGIGKSWLVQTLGYVAATGGKALGFSAEEPVNTLHIDGEMAGPDLQGRYGSIREKLGGPAPANLVVLAADWQDDFLPRLDTVAGQLAVEPYVEKADLIIIDNRSTCFDPESEKDATAWQAAQNWLLSLRRRRKSVITVHHSNRAGDARGHSKPEDVMDLLIKLSRPDGYSADQGARFIVDFEKARGVTGAALASFEASLTPDGWQVEGAEGEIDRTARKLREYLALAHRAGDRPKSATRAIAQAKVNRNAGFAAWAKLKESGELREHPDGGWFLA